ncbi:MAG: hypothetical protein HQK93_01125, partial [Nitrospirae bacterium]|nr:hypothetical protein [Nitrospirota bacterium]
MTNINLANKNLQQLNKSSKKIEGTAIVIDAREIFWAPDVNTVFQKMLNVTNADRALKSFFSDQLKYSSIISNWELADIAGIEVLETVRNVNNPNFLIPFILLIPTSTYDVLIKDIAWANELGINDIISWPFSMDKIVAKIKNFSDFHDKTSSHRSLLYSASTQLLEGAFSEALKTLDSYETLSPSVFYDHYIPFFRGRAAEEQGDSKNAEEYYRKSIE